MSKEAQLRIAVVEDDAAVAATLSDMLTNEGYRAIPCATGSALRDLVAQNAVDFVLLDLNLPDSNGLALAAFVRAKSDLPIIILTGKSDEIDRIVGLEVGADDYIVKPFSLREVAARIRAVMRRGRGNPAPALQIQRGYRFANWILDTDLRRLYTAELRETPLTGSEFNLLLSLVMSAGRILTREQLLDATHRGDSQDVFDRTIDVLILRLRRKIEVNPHSPQLILTERGTGYRFNATVESLGDRRARLEGDES